ncbi:serine protease grass-like [Drosophila guanche]|uniref:CLIP domain-containing serine protease n=1 Tax=Drosophila guanche TaxID=7266 RepID=A0A3B0J1A3_DROGU|nr:serine protease grass-like [Drosophila guanche]SPP74635.1 blast:Serine protease easter [Drosophila guanche]
MFIRMELYALKNVLLWIILWLLAVGNLAENVESCLYCVPIDECGKLFGILQQGKSAPFEDIRLLYQSGCNDYRGLFCCGNDLKGIEELELQKPHCGVSESNPVDFRIINGEEVKLSTRPWMALFLTNSSANGQHFCGGSLITKKFVLSAAHCFTKREYNDLNSVVVRLGEHDVRHARDCRTYWDKEICAPPSEDFAIKRIISHEFFSHSSNYHDIALVELATQVDYKIHIKPICLPLNVELQQLAETLDSFSVAGWGKLNAYAARGSDVLMATDVRRSSRIMCTIKYSMWVKESQICAGSGTTTEDSCHGDSGGPLGSLVNYFGRPRFVQFGLVSFGSRNCQSQAVYTNVGAHLPWITENIVE